jgi:hypothetical protein
MVLYTYNPSTWEAESGGFENSLGYIARPCLRQNLGRGGGGREGKEEEEEERRRRRRRKRRRKRNERLLPSFQNQAG